MSEDLNLLSTCVFRDKEYVLSLKLVASHTLDVKVTDKMTGEVWAGSYDVTYIENLTHKTGNFKQFEVFLSMIRSGFLRTSDSITLDLLSYEDLEALRSLRTGTSTFYATAVATCNKRYLIVTYSVEFDRIHYPLPLDYCGPPNPLLLQATIRKLEAEVISLKEALERRQNVKDAAGASNFAVVRDLENRINELTSENCILSEEVEQLTTQLSELIKPSHTEMKRTVRIIEEQVERDRQNFQEQIKLLQNENEELKIQLTESRDSQVQLKAQLKGRKVSGDVKCSSIPANRRLSIRRNKYQLPPLPDSLSRRGVGRNFSPIGARNNMMGDGIHVREERRGLSPRRPVAPAVRPPPLLSRTRQYSISSASSVRSLDSTSSRESRGRRKDKRTNRERDGVMRSSSVESKASRCMRRGENRTNRERDKIMSRSRSVESNDSKNGRRKENVTNHCKGRETNHFEGRDLMRSLSLESNVSNGKSRENVTIKKKEKDGRRTLAPSCFVSTKCLGTDKSKANAKKSSTNLRKTTQGSSDSIHTDHSNSTRCSRNNTTPKKSEKLPRRILKKVSSNESKKSSSELEDRIRALQRLLKDKVHL